jgi:hypothetical protein
MAKAGCGPKPDQPGLVANGTISDLVSVTGFAAKFSPIPRIERSPFGSEIGGNVADLV